MSVAYWRSRARALGERAVVSLDHPDEASLDEVTARHRALLLPLLRERLRGDEGVVLDLGCGVGRFTAALAEAVVGRAIGVDPVAELLALAPPDPRVELRAMAPPEIPLADGEADVVFCAHVLGGIAAGAPLAACAAEVQRVLRPGGLLFVAESVSDAPPLDHWTFRTADALRAAFAFANLEVVTSFDDAGDPGAVLAGRSSAGPWRR